MEWVKGVTRQGGVVTLDVGPNHDPNAGPIGAIAEEQLAQVRAIQTALGKSGAGALPARGRCADAFLGLHFDFHAGPDCTEIGKRTTREMVAEVIDLVHPDYIQIDCKGHPGLSSYPTKVGNRAPGFVEIHSAFGGR